MKKKKMKKLRKKLKAIPKRIPDSIDLDMMAEARCIEDDSQVPLETFKASVKEYDGRIILHVPKSLYEQLCRAAIAEGVSLQQYTLYKLSRPFGAVKNPEGFSPKEGTGDQA